MKGIKGFGLDLLLILATAVVVFVAAPMSIISANLSDFAHIDPRLTTVICAIFAAVAATILAAIAYPGLYWRKTRPLASTAVRLLFFFTLVTSLFVPLASSAGQIEIVLIPVSKRDLLLAVVLAVTLTAASFSRFRGIVLAAAAVMVVGTAATGVATANYSITSQAAKTQELLQVSSKENIFVLSFDGLPRDVVLEVIRENERFATALSDFVLFDQVISSGAATTASLTSETSGIPNLKKDYGTEDKLYVQVTEKDRTIPTVLGKHGFLVSTYNAYNCCYKGKERHFDRGALTDVLLSTRIDQAAEAIDYGLARTLTGRFAVARDWVRRFASLLPISTDAQSTNLFDLQARTINHKGRDWDVDNIRSITDLERYVSSLTVATDRKVAQFLHFTHTHYPVDFDRGCRYRSDDAFWYNANQNRDGLKEQVRCAVGEFTQFVQRLKDIGAYDNALVVLKSDHGEPVAWMDPNRYEGFAIRGHEYWGFGRYTPFLAVKGVGQRRNQFAVDSRHVALSDLANSICRATIVAEFDCGMFAGFNLFNPDAKISDGATYNVYIVQSASSDFRLDTHEDVELPRNVRFEAALNDYLTNELLTGPSDCGAKINVAAGNAYNNGRTDHRSWVTWRDGQTRYLKLAAPDCKFGALEILLKGATSPGSLDLAVNDRPAEFQLLRTNESDLMLHVDVAAPSGPIVVALRDGSGSRPDFAVVSFKSNTD